jgi:TonB family protein
MARAFKVFASYLQFKEVLDDPLGHLYRAGEFDAGGVKRSVWLRVFDRNQVPAADVIAAFDRARSIASVLQSANVAAGVDCVVDDGTPAMACEYVSSQPLSAVFQRVADEQFPVPVDNALLIVEKIALALSSALTVEVDGGRVVHGFLHPGLIFVTNDGEGVVSGFGFGDQLLTLIDDDSSTQIVHPYLAPEVLLTRMASRHGDVYSLGAILFHLLCGSALPAHPEKRPEAITGARLTYEDVPLPGDIKALLLRALAHLPGERFSSVPDFKKELARLLYGGAYSPTTFNLALFMDRLFRSEIEAEEEDRAAETAVDVTPYLAPVVEPTLEPLIAAKADAGPQGGNRRGLWIGFGAAAAVLAAAAVTIFMVTRGPETQPLPPTPTAAEIAAQRQAQEEKMRELAQGLVAEMMAEKEEEIRRELLDRQTTIEDLQKKLQASERRAEQGQLTNDDQSRREELQQQIAAEEEAQRIREAELEVERQRAAEETRRQAAARQTATAVVEEESRRAAAAIPTSAPSVAESPSALTSAPTTASKPAVPVEDNGVVDLSELDSLPVVIKEQDVAWPRAARFSRRQGVVIIQATVDTDGLVEDVMVLRADDEGFGITQAVIDAVMQYRFKPGTKNGVPVKTHTTVTKAYRFVVR